MSVQNNPFGTIKDQLKIDRQGVNPANLEIAIKNLNSLLTYVEGMLEGLAPPPLSESDKNDSENSIHKNEAENAYEVTENEFKQEPPLSFRDKDTANQLSYTILAFMELKKNQPLSLKKVSNAVETVFGFTNSASINTKLNRWKEDGYIQWPHPDRRKITTKGTSLIDSYADLVEPNRKSEIDSLLENI